MKSTILTLLFWAFALYSNAAVENVKIHGTIKGLGNDEIALLDFSQKEIAKVNAQDDRFEISTQTEIGNGSYYFLYIPSVGPLGLSMSIPRLFIFIDTPEIEVNAEINDKKVSKNYIKGSPMMDEYESILKNLPVEKELGEAGKAYNKAFHEYNMVAQTDENHENLKKASDHLDKLQQTQSQQLLDLIPGMNKSKALALIIYQYNNYKPADELEILLNQFDPSIHDCFALKQMQEKIRTERGCEIGMPSPDFELKDQNGKLIKLSSLRGNYTLIDFWASWCGPCRKEIPNLKKVYAQFKDKGLQLVGVSIDHSEVSWRKAIQEEQLDYLQLIDPKNTCGKLYNFTGIPFIILISPEGIILEKGLRGAEVSEKIAKYLN